MAKRQYALPGIQDLSKEQDAVLALPREGRHLIVGGPGTGKSVLALLRARRYQRNGDSYLFLVFNHILHQASRQLHGTDLVSETWVSWFHRLFFDVTGEPVPHAPEGADGFEPINWNGVEDVIDAMPSIPDFERPMLVIDEGQDMPPQFYGCLVNLGFENFFVVADQNQQIKEENSSRAAIANALDISANQVFELTTNYRNAWPVARLARAFYTGDPATPPPELPAQSPVGAADSTPKLYEYQDSNLERIAKGILRMADRDPRQLIGILTPSNDVRQRYYDALRSTNVELDSPRPSVETFHRGHRPEISFAEGGILIINAQACKGLEFDAAVLADIEEHYVLASDPDPAKRLFYVMVARARERVFLLMRRGAARVRYVESILPTDPSVLRREEV